MRRLDWMRTVRQNFASYDFAINDAMLLSQVPRVYAMLVSWFGDPADLNVPCDIVLGPTSGAGRDWWTRRYVIMIANDASSDAERLSVLAHEMYHRVTSKRRGLNRLLWVDEMLAILCEQRILTQNTYTAYARLVFEAYNTQQRMSTDDLADVRVRMGFLGWSNQPYPDGFIAAVLHLGNKLERVVGWDRLCNLVAVRSWEEWLAALPQDIRMEAKRLLPI